MELRAPARTFRRRIPCGRVGAAQPSRARRTGRCSTRGIWSSTASIWTRAGRCRKGYPAGIEQKILAGGLDEAAGRGNRSRLLRFAPGAFTTEPFVHDYWEEVYLLSGDLAVGAGGGRGNLRAQHLCLPPAGRLSRPVPLRWRLHAARNPLLRLKPEPRFTRVRALFAPQLTVTVASGGGASPALAPSCPHILFPVPCGRHGPTPSMPAIFLRCGSVQACIVVRGWRSLTGT